MEFDFYTAVDDLRSEDTQGSDMLGTVEFNSACFYRYANIDVEQLKGNLDDEELAHKTVAAFIRAAVTAVPSGKRNSTAPQNPPSFVFVVARDAGLWSLANAFVKPVRPTQGSDLIENSIKALDEYWGQLATMYGAEHIRGKWVASLTPNGLTHLKDAKVESVGDIINNVCQQLKLTSKLGVS
jgi:CRISPR system Cascade subunit CasC